MDTPADPLKPIEPTTPPVVPTQIMEPEDLSGDTTDHVTDIALDHIQMLERKIEALSQVVHQQREALEQQPSAQQSRPPRILFLTTPLMRGADVTTLQRALGLHPDRIDGIFGKNTDRAVRTFQRQRRMTVDGKAGLDTLDALTSLR